MLRKLRLALLVVAAIVLVGVVAGVLYLRSDSFRHFVIARVVRQIEQTTGGRVELHAFHYTLRPLQVELHGLVIHGLEKPGDPPLVSAPDVLIQLHLTSLLRRQVDWRLLRAVKPEMHLTTYPGGRTNFPEPKIKRTEGRGPLDKIWDLRIDRLEVEDGVFVWNDRPVRVDFAADNVGADLSYDAARSAYTGNVSLQAHATRHVGRQTVSPPASVSAHYTLRRNSLEVTGVTVNTARSSVSGSATLAPFVDPRLEFDYQGSVDAREAAQFLDIRNVTAGAVLLKGKLHYDSATGGYGSTGDAKFERIGYHSREYDLPRLDGSAKFDLAPDRLVVKNGRYYLLGGRAEGDITIDTLHETPRVRATGDLHNFSVNTLLKQASTSRAPLDRLGWVGSVEGRASVQFRYLGEREEIADLRVESNLHVTPPVVVPPGRVPVSGGLHMQYSPADRLFHLQNTFADTPGTHWTAAGTVDLARRGDRTSIAVKATVTDLRELQPLLAALRPGTALPLEVRGQAQFEGAVRGALGQPSIEGRLEIRSFIYAGRPWDRFAGDVAYTPNLLRVTNARLQAGNASAQLNLTAGLVNGELAGGSPITLDTAIHEVALADLQALAGTAYPLTGVVSAQLRLAGTKADPRGSGAVEMTQGALEGEPFDSLRADIVFGNQEVQANGITLRKNGGTVTGAAAYRIPDRHYRFQARGTHIALSNIRRLHSQRVVLTGVADFQASGEGTTDRPALNADVRVADLVANGERVGNLTAHIQTRDELLEARVESQLLRGNLVANVSVRMSGDFPAGARAELKGVDLDPLLAQSLRGRLTAHSTATGFVTLSGPLKRPAALEAKADITNFEISLQDAAFRNTGPLRASYRNGVVTLDSAHLSGPDTNVTATGTIKVSGPPASRALNVQLNGAVNLALLGTFNPNLESSGQVVTQTSVTGTLARPLVIGRAEFKNGNLALRDYATGLSNIRGAVTFDAHHVQLQNVRAEIGGGPLTLGGFVNYGAGEQPVFRLTAVANSVRIRYPEGTSSVLDGNLQLTGTLNSSRLSGDLVVSRVRFDPRFDLASTLGRSRTPLATPGANPILLGMRLDVHVASSPEMRFEFAQARNVQMDANLRVRGTAARPALLGHISLLAGEINFAGTNYEVNRGDILFTNPFRIDPVVNLSLSTRVQQYNIAINLSGPLDRLNLSYRSDPPLPSTDIQMMLITGRTREESVVGSQQSTAIGANTVLSQALNTAVSSRVQRIFGVSRLKIDPQVGGPETNPGARVTLQQQVTQDIRFTYITNLSQTQQQVIQVEWQINDNWSVLAVRDQNGLVSVDLRWRTRFR